MDKGNLVTWLRYLISINRLDTFYHSRHWKKIKREVLQEQHWECEKCRVEGILTIVREDKKRSGVVHHMKEVRKHPHLALSTHYIDEKGKKQRNLIVLCNKHHEEIHERMYKRKSLNEERW